VYQHGQAALAVLKRGSAKRKTPKGGTKRALEPGGPPGQANLVKSSETPAMLKKAPLACEQKATREVRGQTRGTGPTHRHKRWPTPRKMVETRKRSHKRVSSWSASRWRNHQPKQAKRPHSKSDGRKAFDGQGNYSLGLAEQLVFPELNPDKFTRVQGMNIAFVTSTDSDDESREMLRLLGVPFQLDEKKGAN